MSKVERQKKKLEAIKNRINSVALERPVFITQIKQVSSATAISSRKPEERYKISPILSSNKCHQKLISNIKDEEKMEGDFDTKQRQAFQQIKNELALFAAANPKTKLLSRPKSGMTVWTHQHEKLFHDFKATRPFHLAMGRIPPKKVIMGAFLRSENESLMLIEDWMHHGDENYNEITNGHMLSNSCSDESTDQIMSASYRMKVQKSAWKRLKPEHLHLAEVAVSDDVHDRHLEWIDGYIKARGKYLLSITKCQRQEIAGRTKLHKEHVDLQNRRRAFQAALRVTKRRLELYERQKSFDQRFKKNSFSNKRIDSGSENELQRYLSKTSFNRTSVRKGKEADISRISLSYIDRVRGNTRRTVLKSMQKSESLQHKSAIVLQKGLRGYCSRRYAHALRRFLSKFWIRRIFDRSVEEEALKGKADSRSKKEPLQQQPKVSSKQSATDPITSCLLTPQFISQLLHDSGFIHTPLNPREVTEDLIKRSGLHCRSVPIGAKAYTTSSSALLRPKHLIEGYSCFTFEIWYSWLWENRSHLYSTDFLKMIYIGNLMSAHENVLATEERCKEAEIANQERIQQIEIERLQTRLKRR